jgi:uncharacterized protein YndB with AHSA1/START domain
MVDTGKEGRLSLEVRRTLHAPRERVFGAWTDPEALKVWFVHPGYEIPRVEIDARVGGRYRIVMRKLPDGEPFEVSGIYREVRPPERLSFTWTWSTDPDGSETLVTVEFRKAGAGTEVVLTHARFAKEDVRRDHEQGWGICLDGLARRLS